MPSFPAGAHHRGGQNAAVTNTRAAKAFYAPLLPVVVDLRQRGLSLRAIAKELEARGLRTRQEWPHWSATQVRRLLARAAAEGIGRPQGAPQDGN